MDSSPLEFHNATLVSINGEDVSLDSEGAHTSPDSFSSITIIFVTLVTLLPIMRPISRRVALPKTLSIPFTKLADYGNAHKSESPTRTMKLSIDYRSAPLLASLILLVTTAINIKTVWHGIVGDDLVRPYQIILFFFGIALIVGSLEQSGVFLYMIQYLLQKSSKTDAKRTTSIGSKRVLPTRGTHRGSEILPSRLETLSRKEDLRWDHERLSDTQQKRADRNFFITIHIASILLTLCASPDIVILTTSPVIISACKLAGNNPIPYLYTAFLTAFTWSLLLAVGNTTNVIVCTSMNISFTEYSKWMTVPALVGGLANFVCCVVLFRYRHVIAKSHQPESDGSVETGLCPGEIKISSIPILSRDIELNYVEAHAESPISRSYPAVFKRNALQPESIPASPAATYSCPDLRQFSLSKQSIAQNPEAMHTSPDVHHPEEPEEKKDRILASIYSVGANLQKLVPQATINTVPPHNPGTANSDIPQSGSSSFEEARATTRVRVLAPKVSQVEEVNKIAAVFGLAAFIICLALLLALPKFSYPFVITLSCGFVTLGRDFLADLVAYIRQHTSRKNDSIGSSNETLPPHDPELNDVIIPSPPVVTGTSRFRQQWPHTTATLQGLPYDFIPFLLGFYILAAALESSPWLHLFGTYLLAKPLTVTPVFLQPLYTALIAGVVSMITSNQPMSILLSRAYVVTILGQPWDAASTSASATALNPQQLGQVFGIIIGSNLGCSFAVQASLGGILFRRIAYKESRIRIRCFSMMKYLASGALLVMIVTCLVAGAYFARYT